MPTQKNSKVLLRFGQRLRAIRKSKNLSQEDLAAKAGLHRTYIGSIERGEKNLSLLNIEKLANALDLNISSLFAEKEQ